MNWQNFYLICFLVGFALSFLSFLLGSFSFHLHFHAHADAFHLPHFHIHTGDGLGHSVVSGGNGGVPAHGLDTGDAELSWFNFGSITAFLAWFGGTGYLLTRYSGMWLWVSFAIALLAGFFGASLMFWFIAKVLMKHDKPLDPLDYRMVGVLGTLSMPIREGGTGEIVFVQEGVRRCSGARSETGEVIAKGAEVIVTRYEKGIAYVRRWEDMTNEDSSAFDADHTKEA